MTRGAHQLGWRAAIGWTDVAGTALSCPVLFSFSRSGQRERKREREEQGQSCCAAGRESRGAGAERRLGCSAPANREREE
jgi:hypothetical protein